MATAGSDVYERQQAQAAIILTSSSCQRSSLEVINCRQVIAPLPRMLNVGPTQQSSTLGTVETLKQEGSLMIRNVIQPMSSMNTQKADCQGYLRFSCRARGMSTDHNPKVRSTWYQHSIV